MGTPTLGGALISTFSTIQKYYDLFRALLQWKRFPLITRISLVTHYIHNTVLQRALAVPVHSETSPFIMPVGEVALTQLQEAILSAIQVLHTVC